MNKNYHMDENNIYFQNILTTLFIAVVNLKGMIIEELLNQYKIKNIEYQAVFKNVF